MKRQTLEQKQQAMRRRHVRPRRGRVLKQWQPVAPDLGEKFQRRVAAVVLLKRGYSAAQLAAHFNVNASWVQDWIARGCPLL
jgi:hypothetical protein